MRLILLLAAVGLMTAPQVRAQAPATSARATTAAPVPVLSAVQFDLDSNQAGRTYRIFVFKPITPPPPSGYPVVVVTDGNSMFPTAATISLFESLAGLGGSLVVGVGYPASDAVTPMELRNRDLTPATPLANIRLAPGQAPATAAAYGGSEDFYRFLTLELRPVIAAQYKVDPNRQALYGHSLGGLFTLGVLFNHTAAFSTYLVSSPSIWWNARAVLKDEEGFARKVESGAVSPRVLIMVGAKEQEPPQTLPPGMTREQVAKRLNESRMVDNARELAERLQGLKGAPPYTVALHVFEGEDHMSVIPASLGRALAYALTP